ncbi:MAG: N-acyl homoserine lactonase family protein [Deltaproteobacteria bacterium]|nr:N-acyl homoserine lactonase family protein [Deltaproteobacteria bacterium]
MWKIIPLDLGIIEVARSSNIMKADYHAGEKVNNISIAWLLVSADDGRKVMIDTGPIEDEAWSREYHVPSIRERDDQRLVPALRKHGVSPQEIGKVILTHLHWDHAYGVDKLPNAKVYVQSKEIRHAVNPGPLDARIYETKIKVKIPFFLKYYNQMEIIDGDVAIDDGISTVLLPGHSPGSQGVLIDTPQGRFLIAGDLINTIENWESRLPCGLHTDLQACFDSFAKIETIGAKILPSHDNLAFEIFKDNLLKE